MARFVYHAGMIRPLLRAPLSAVAACATCLLTAPAAHAFDDLFERPAVSKADECRNGFLDYRIAEWRRRDRAPTLDQGSSVEQIMQDVDPPALRALADSGCSDTYRFMFLDCTQVDWPEDADPTPEQPGEARIAPIGVSAETVPKMTAVIRDCLVALDEAGLSPADAR